MDKLTPQYEEQEHMVQILLAKMQGIDVEFYDNLRDEWVTSTSYAVVVGENYRIKSHELPITKEMWAVIDKKWKFASMDENGKVYFCTDKPYLRLAENCWVVGCGHWQKSILAINTDGIDWRKSLTRRPEGV